MTDEQMTEMDTSETKHLLESHNTGNLALSEDGQPYSIPVTYRYHEGRIYLKLGYTKDSRKIEIIEQNPNACLNVFDTQQDADDTGPYSDLAWASIVIKGKLKELEPKEAAGVSISTEEGSAPGDPWGEPRSEVNFKVYRIIEDEISGRKGGDYRL